MEPGAAAEIVLRCSACAYPEVWSWEVTGAEEIAAAAEHDPGVDLRLEVVQGAVEVTVSGCARVYRAGESVIIPTGAPRTIAPEGLALP